MSFGLPPLGGIGASFKILEILEYACGLRPTTRIRYTGNQALRENSAPPRTLSASGGLNQNPIFEIASINFDDTDP
jgi:hypothetical protein